MTLNGWQRIGVVLSALWLLMVLSYAGFEYSAADKNRFLSAGESHVFVYWASPEIIDPYDLHIGENLDRLSERERLDILGKRERISQGLSVKVFFGRLSVGLLIPILAAWVLAYALVFIIRWVRTGFSSERRDT